MRILIVNPFGIGDVLFTTPLIRALRYAFPASRLGYVCNRRTEPILRHNAHLDEVFVYERDDVVALFRSSPWAGLRHTASLLRGIRRARYDVAIDLSLSERYSWILAWLGVGRRIGFNYRSRALFLTDSLPIDGYHDAYVVEYYRRLLHFIGIELTDLSLELQTSEGDDAWAQRWLAQQRVQPGDRLIGIVPAGGVSWGIHAAFRRWTVEGFAAVADALIEGRGVRVLLFGEASDQPICDTVIRLMRHPAINASGQTTLGQFISLLKHLDLVICNDGGPLHLAVSQGVKTVSIFGPVDPVVYGPNPASRVAHRVVHRDDLLCRPCYHNFRLPPCPYERTCLRELGTDQVLAACTDILATAETVN